MKYDRSRIVYMAQSWGDWNRAGCIGLGYPGETPVSRMLTSPSHGKGGKPPSPVYEPDPIARRFDEAVQRVDTTSRGLLYARFVYQLSDLRISRILTQSPGQIRWAVEKALRNISAAL